MGVPGCCIGALLLALGPRVVLFAAWWMSDWYDAFDHAWVAALGWLFMPWTSLAWIYVHFHHAGQLSGGYVLLLCAGVLVDLASHGSSTQARRRDR